MQRVVVFGATGSTGAKVVDTALGKGYAVRAFVRNAKALAARDRLEIAQGSLEDMAALKAAVAGASAVLVALGPRREDPKPFTAKATANILRAMAESGVMRIVVLTGAMIGDGYPNRGGMYRRMRKGFVRKTPEIAKDRDEQERVVTASPLEWTVVKPPLVTDGARRGGVRAGTDLKVGMTAKIGREDLADFLVAQVAGRDHVRKAVFAMY